ncbi:hypothetical protein BurJ1DRAFT_3162 [Burkholderiales bacterium JOSHI_001]|nr:hypothetical protein BurJ1DRAFT_3162 [Burkholderiales bacterium JOSHI_001]
MARPTIEPVTDVLLPDFARFLHEHLMPSRSPQEWAAGLSTNWCTDAPNHGFALMDEGRIVGGIGAYYADRLIDGQPERFCNITSWCVLESHRQQSMRLAMTVVGQKGWHFTDFSPTQVVAGTLQFLKFKPLDERQVVGLNLPWRSWGGPRCIADPDAIDAALAGTPQQRVYRDHRGFAWLQHVLVGHPGQWCHVVYKRRSYKRLPSAHLIYASDPAMLRQGWRALGGHLLARGLVSTHVEFRLLGETPWPSAVRSGFNPKLFLSNTLQPGQIDYLYSESVALDL